MIRPLAIALVAATLGVLGYSYYATRTPAQPSKPDPVAVHARTETRQAPQPATQQPDSPVQPSAVSQSREAPSAQAIARWIAETHSADPQARAAAIASLAQAPKSQAITPLKQVLEVGEPEVDRPLALQSLHTLALEQGDDDGSIRNVLRGVMYHGDDEGVSQNAQALLEDIETELALRTSH